MDVDTLWAIFGWIGSAVVVFSLLQTRMLWLRVFNLVGCVLAVIYNTPLGIWPSVGLNAAISAINIVQLIRLRRERTAPVEAPLVVETAADDAVVSALLGARRAEVEERAGRELEALLGDAVGARLSFAGDRVAGCALRLRDGAELVVLGETSA